jgi:ABC-type cobalamin transport system permease subunit
LEIEMKHIHKIAAALVAATAAQAAFANVLPPNAVPEPGVLGLVGVALVAAVYFSKRRK